MFQCVLDKLTAWAEKWQIQITISKCSVMHIGPPPSIEKDYCVNGLSLLHIASNRDLGVVVNVPMLPLLLSQIIRDVTLLFNALFLMVTTC